MAWVGGEWESLQMQTGSAEMRPSSSHVMHVQRHPSSRVTAAQYSSA